jgi:transcriptional regulator with XRE-family HTH domain
MPTIRRGMTPRKGTRVRKTIQQLREERGESQSQLAKAIGVTTEDVAAWEAGVAEPTISRLRVLTEHFGVRNDQINLRPGDPPSFGDRLADAF